MAATADDHDVVSALRFRRAPLRLPTGLANGGLRQYRKDREARSHKGRTSFLKKRSKKLLFITGDTEATHLGKQQQASSKSFLVLFFKKERSSFLTPVPNRARRANLLLREQNG
jgi:hypothetical protein